MADPVNLSIKEKSDKLDNFLRTRKRQSSRRGEVTLSKVKEEAALILEEFLKQQLRRKSLTGETIVGTRYQNVTDIEIVKKETNSYDKISSYFECESLEENIPYADEDDIGIRARSEPPNAQYYGAEDNNLLHPEAVNNYRLVKSKSLSPCPSHPREFHLNLKREIEMPPSLPNHSSFITNEGFSRGKSSLYPPPPPPPSTPYTGSEQSSKRSSPVLQIYQVSDSSTSSPVKFISDKSTPSPVMGTSDNSTSSQVTGTSDKNTPSSITGTSDKISSPTPVTVTSYKSTPSSVTGTSDKSTPPPVTSTSDKSTPSPVTHTSYKSTPSSVTGTSDKSTPSPVTGTSDKSTPSPVSLSEYDQGTARSSNSKKFSSLPESDMGSSSKTHMKIPPSKIRHRSGSISSADTDAEEIDERKKKSMFKRARERLSRVLSIQRRKKDSKDEKNKENRKKPRLRNRKNNGLELDGPDQSMGKQSLAKESIDEAVENGGIFGTLRRLTWGSIRKKKSGVKTTPERKLFGNAEVYIGSHSHKRVISLGKDFGDNVQADSVDLPKDESHLPNTESDTYQKFQKQTTNIKSHVHLDLSADTDLEMDDSSDEGKANNVPFVKKSEEEKEVIYQKIADRLVVIGDNFIADCHSGHSHTESSRGVSSASSPNSKSEVEASADGTNLDVIKKTQLTSLEKDLTDCFKQKANEIDERLESEAKTAVLRILRQGVTYTNFQREVTRAIGNEVGWNQLSALFHITKRAVAMVGAGGAQALQIKELSLQYIADRYASWIVGQGGWDSMLSGEDTDLD
ncbi:hypothetical protein CHS0354_018859 [Potamilus streckersoni]|uniref:Uncharacterized protein n=1 Tax=Potamilus streckersoni TaxID=2493646 RepID=A0AAE0SCI5_9BIVA|nr:hypothetical protein CHS0354_018859 [Potamilus streckersoni]